LRKGRGRGNRKIHGGKRHCQCCRRETISRGGWVQGGQNRWATAAGKHCFLEKRGESGCKKPLRLKAHVDKGKERENCLPTKKKQELWFISTGGRAGFPLVEKQALYGPGPRERNHARKRKKDLASQKKGRERSFSDLCMNGPDPRERKRGLQRPGQG